MAKVKGQVKILLDIDCVLTTQDGGGLSMLPELGTKQPAGSAA